MTATPTKWRLLRTHPASGAWNMALDEAILDFAGQGKAPPTIRLYAWTPPCLSIGYAQIFGDVDFERLKLLGWDIVRRPTGGRAILHTDELTYSICGMESEEQLKGGVLESYQRLSLALLEALNSLGIDADQPRVADPANVGDSQNPVCFEVPSNYEITVGGKKLIGSAQARRKSGVLQHGSLPLEGDLTRIIDILNFPDEEQRERARQRLLDHATTVEGVLGYPGNWWHATYAFSAAFQKVLDIEFHSMQLTPAEGKRAFELYMDKYNHPQWTMKT